MNTAVRILCIIPKFHHLITDLLMNLQWLTVHQRILLEVLFPTYQAYFLYHNSRNLRSNNKSLINPDNP